VVDDGDTDQDVREPRSATFGLALLILRTVVFAVLLTGGAWAIATYAFDWAGIR
jgi:hypothetical protein